MYPTAKDEKYRKNDEKKLQVVQLPKPSIYPYSKHKLGIFAMSLVYSMNFKYKNGFLLLK